ncbi:MAG: HD domain-containing protein [Eubacterium sp.]|nr:HD domain-containing protein [Eubacterium sp.]
MAEFEKLAAVPGNDNWEKLTHRKEALYSRTEDVRSPFGRDYTRILHSRGYRRMKHKTQVFYNIDNDHICTRMEHVAHVESVAGTIAAALGLNQELTKAIAIGHDIGHAPFGHQGEHVLDELSRKYLGTEFWHERNGLHFVDDVELLADNYNEKRNLDLTYAVRDGIISHCGELDQNGLHPRDGLIDLDEFRTKGQFQPATWDGCVVKMADKIAYVGRDIEDAISLGFIGDEEKQQLIEMARANDERAMNTTVIMHNMIIDICENSTPEKGICLSERFSDQLNEIKKFNYRYIYGNKRFKPYQEYSALVLNQIFDSLLDQYDGRHTWDNLAKERRYRPETIASFEGWLAEYCEPKIVPEGPLKQAAFVCRNRKIYGTLDEKEQYIHAVLDYVSGMSDRFAVKVFGELLKY